jgi:hypothetical protein
MGKFFAIDQDIARVTVNGDIYSVILENVPAYPFSGQHGLCNALFAFLPTAFRVV